MFSQRFFLNKPIKLKYIFIDILKKENGMTYLKSSFRWLIRGLIYSDQIGNEIKLYNIERNGTRHKTVFGGILSIVVILLSIACSIFFFMDIILRVNPKAYQLTKFQDDVPRLSFNQQGMFFGIQYTNPRDLTINLYDERAVSYYGVMQTFKTGETIGRYKLRKCVYSQDFIGLENLFTKTYESEINSTYLCVDSMMVNGTEVKKGEPSYVDPYTQHGMGSKSQDPIFFEVGANRCVNSTENNNFCYSNEVISKMLTGSNYKINFIDNMFDTNNYYSPVNSFVHQIDGQASPNNFAANYLNLLNVEFKTHNGLVFDSVEEFGSFRFNDRVEIVSAITDGSPLVGRIFMFRLELQNTPGVYERYYTRVQEVMGSIGGVLKFLFVAAKVVNYFINYLGEKKRDLKNILLQYVDFNDNDDDSHAENPLFLFNNEAKDREEDNVENQEKTRKNPNDMKIGDKKNQQNNKTFNLKEGKKVIVSDKNTRKNKKVSPFQIRQSTLGKAMDLKTSSFLFSKMKRMLTHESDETLLTFEKCNRLKKKIFNELTIYKLFFDIEKLKIILFNAEQKEAFTQMKVDMKTIFEKKPKKTQQQSVVFKTFSMVKPDGKLNLAFNKRFV